eukprot:1742326-Karenia_brevis.AAC.1
MRAALQSLQQDFQRHVVSANQQNEKLLEAVQKCSSDILQHTGKLVDATIKPITKKVDMQREELEMLRSQYDKVVSRLERLEKNYDIDSKK